MKEVLDLLIDKQVKITTLDKKHFEGKLVKVNRLWIMLEEKANSRLIQMANIYGVSAIPEEGEE